MEKENNNVKEGWKMKGFQQHLVEFDFPQIYCDMDGVVADFTKFTADHLGTKFKDDLERAQAIAQYKKDKRKKKKK